MRIIVGTASTATSPTKFITASTASETVITMEPKISTPLRGKRSMISVATMVLTKFTTPMPTDTQIASPSGKPKPLMNTCGRK